MVSAGAPVQGDDARRRPSSAAGGAAGRDGLGLAARAEDVEDLAGERRGRGWRRSGPGKPAPRRRGPGGAGSGCWPSRSSPCRGCSGRAGSRPASRGRRRRRLAYSPRQVGRRLVERPWVGQQPQRLGRGQRPDDRAEVSRSLARGCWFGLAATLGADDPGPAAVLVLRRRSARRPGRGSRSVSRCGLGRGRAPARASADTPGPRSPRAGRPPGRPSCSPAAARSGSQARGAASG